METIWVERVEDNQWKPKAETFDLENDFSIDENNLNREICRMGQLLVRYGTIAAEQKANLYRKEEYAKTTKARVASALRSEAEANGTKMTENKLEEKVINHTTYQQVLNELHILRADALKTESWWRSITKKADLLNSLAYRQNAEIRRMPD